MKLILMLVAGLLVVALIAYAIMAMQSHKKPDLLGLKDGMLLPCPETPNCVCSERHREQSGEHAIAPFALKDAVWEKLKNSIVALGGHVEFDDGDYLHATFTSAIFRYVDDVELRLDAGQKLIHIRSASRIGRSDLGVNRKRVEAIKAFVLK